MEESSEPTFTIVQNDSELVIRLPAPQAEKRSVGCASLLLILAVLVALPMPILFVFRLLDPEPVGAGLWLIFVVILLVTGWLVLSSAKTFRESRLRPVMLEPCEITVGDNVVSISRAGRQRDFDFHWDIPEIADIRICPAAPDRVFISIRSLLMQMLAPDEIVRISVERRTGEVDDVMVRAPGHYWTDALETKLREYLGLSKPAESAE